MKPAGAPIRTASSRLLVVDADGAVTGHARAAIPDLVRRRDLVIANDAATLPASLSGFHVPTGAVVEVRLAGRPIGVRTDSGRADHPRNHWQRPPWPGGSS